MTVTPYLVLTTAAGKLLNSGAQQPDPVRFDTVPFPGRPALSTATTPLFPVDDWTCDSLSSVSLATGAAKASFDPLNVTRAVDGTSPALFGDLCSGTRLKFVDLLLLNNFPGDDYPNIIHEAVGLGEAFVEDLSWSAASGDDQVAESVQFAWSRLWVGYAKLDQYGQPGSFRYKGWDRLANKPL